MSSSPQKVLAIQHNCERARQLLDTLSGEVARGAARMYLDHLVELAGLYVAQTGGTLVTAGLRGELTALRALVQAVPAVTPTPKKETTPMQFEIETDAACPLCTEPGVVYLAGDGSFECHCSACYDPCEDCEPRSCAIGSGASARAAVSAWLECAEGHVPEHVGWWPTNIAAQAQAEFARQKGWTQLGWIELRTSEGPVEGLLLAPPEAAQ